MVGGSPSAAPDDVAAPSEPTSATAIVDASKKDVGQTPSPFYEGRDVSAASTTTIDPAAANVWVEMDNLSTRTVEVRSRDQVDLGNEQLLASSPGSQLDLWGAAFNGTDVWLAVSWCEDPKAKVVDGKCPGSRFRKVKLDFNNSWLGAYVYLSYASDEQRLGPDAPTIRVGEPYTYGPFGDEQPIRFVITRQSDRNITHKILRYQVQIKDGPAS